jgi:hypothetical protein
MGQMEIKKGRSEHFENKRNHARAKPDTPGGNLENHAAGSGFWI